MSVKIADNIVTIRHGLGELLSGLVMLSAGTVTGWYALAYAESHDADSVYVGIALGLAMAVAGLVLPLTALGSLQIDANRRLVVETTYGWRGRSTRVVPFSEVMSIGRDVIKDPRTNLVWSVHGVLRLSDGSTITVADVDAV